MAREEMPRDEEGTDKLEAPADFDGPTDDRHCTDIVCSILIVIMWIAMSGVGAYAVTNGDYRKILNPLDYDGNICGTDFGGVDMTEYPYLYYVNSYSGGVCVKECPKLEGVTADGLTDIYTVVSYGGLYQVEGLAELPSDFIQMAPYNDTSVLCDSSTCFPNNNPALSWYSRGINQGYGFGWYATDTLELFWRCTTNGDADDRIKNITIASGATALAYESEGNDFWNNLYADMFTARAYILGFGIGMAVGIGFFYSLLLRVPGCLGLFAWGSIFATVAILGGSGGYMFGKSEEWTAEDPQIQTDRTILAAQVVSIILFVLAGLLFVFVICLRKQIQLALGCVKEAARAIGAMPLIIFFPILQAAGLVLFMVAWTYYAVFLASMGDLVTYKYTFGPLDTSVSVRNFAWDDIVYRCGWFLFFCFLWTCQFILALGKIILAMCVAKWYFTRDKSTIGSSIVLKCIYDATRYHTGTAAFGSILIAILQLIRAIIAKFQKKAKEMNAQIAEALLCCCQCCVLCFEKCLKFLNKNAYIQTAMFGTNFCVSAKEAFFLIMRNAARIGAIAIISEVITFVGRIFVSCVTAGLAYIAVSEMLRDELYSVAGPCVMIFIIAFFVSDMFMDVFDMAIATILQCFVADEEMFEGEERYAEGALAKWVDTQEEESERTLKVT
eukprot:CAMPEP_0198293602 /NCGR_PEP_ID=MMETSP1449-20131203/17936_1 /TAXON_ID=420275 /ORGANISM="Attheya septentrionalis, Strain CCMP2084" /LENGTH=668 /DNA_ID=CAMNT_0043993243 /DNA_START=95 /DNA_END=2101 /DNA_ORIENTATION=+